MAVTFTIGGTDRSSKVELGSLKVGMALGSEWSATFAVRDTLSTSSAYRPSLGQSVVIADGATTVFKGNISRVEDLPIADPHVGTLTRVTARSYAWAVDRVVVNKNHTSSHSLKVLVSDLVTTYLTAFGISLDGAMASGPTLEPQVWEDVTLREVLNRLSTITGWLWRITPGDVLEFFSAGTKTASYSLTAANRQSVGPVRWEKARERYVNSVYLRYGTETQVEKTFTATGNGSTSTWTLDYDPAVNAANGFIVSRGLVTEGGVEKTLSAPGGGGQYTWTAATNLLTRAAGNLGSGVVISLVYTAQFPQVVTAADAAGIAANGTYKGIFEAPDIFDKDAATELAIGLLRRNLEEPKRVFIGTRQGFVMPGDQITLTFTDRTVSGSHIITDVQISDIAKGSLLYGLTCLSGGEHQETWTDQLRAQIGSGGANAAGGTISGSVVPNFSGRFSSDVVANVGGNSVGDYETALTTFTNSGGFGPAVVLGRPDADAYRWAMFSDANYGSGRLAWHMTKRGSSVECAFQFIEAALDEYVLVPGDGGSLLWLGDPNGVAGIGSPQNTIAGIKTDVLKALDGVFERARSVRMGDWATYTPTRAGTGGNTWSAGTTDFRYTVVGTTVTINWVATGTTVGVGGGASVTFTVPAGLVPVADARYESRCRIYNNARWYEGVAIARNIAGAGTIELFIYDPATFNYINYVAGVTNNDMRGQIKYEV